MAKENELKLKPVSACAPLLLLLLSSAARADLEPFSFGARETISHDDNLNHSSDGDRVSSWISSTEFSAALDQAVGRDRLIANASVDYSTYSHVDNRDSTGYNARAQFDWSTVGDLSGSFEADSQRRRYVYGVESGDFVSTSTDNQETTNHGSARIELGGLARWNLFAGFDAMNRKYSEDSYSTNDERQWSTNVGTRYSTSPDLWFGVTGNYVHGEYPHYIPKTADAPTSEGFNSKSIDLTARLQASGNSSLDASVGYTTENSDIQPTLRFVNGSVNWIWTPPSHFSVHLGLARSSNGGATAGNLSTLNDRSLNNTASLSVTYAFTGKISLVGNADYIQRKYSGVQIPVQKPDGSFSVEPVDGTNHVARFGLRAHYQPSRTTDLSCGGSHESLSADSAIRNFTPNYTDTLYSCIASITFN